MVDIEWTPKRGVWQSMWPIPQDHDQEEFINQQVSPPDYRTDSEEGHETFTATSRDTVR